MRDRKNDILFRHYLRLIEGDDGGGGDGGSGGGDEGGDEGASGDGKGGKQPIAQVDLDKILRREKTQAARAERKKVLEEIGLDPEKFDAESIKGVLGKAASDEAERVGAAETAKREAEAERDSAKAERASAARDRMLAKVERKLVLAAGLDPTGDDDDTDTKRLSKLLNMTAADLDADSSADDIDAALEEVKADFPELFTGETGGDSGNGGKPPASDRGGPSRRQRQSQSGGKDSMTKGRERAATQAGSGESGFSFLK